MEPHGFREHCPGTDVPYFCPLQHGFFNHAMKTNHLKHKFTFECSSMQ